MNILFVCTGNTCRSSMAEGIFKFMLKSNNIENISVSSAGLSAYNGDLPNENAIKVLNKKGIDISGHRARQLTNQITNESDLILTMTSSHKRYILKLSPEYSQKVYTLKEYSYIINNECVTGKNLDIADPFGLDYNVYEKCSEEIEIYILKILNNINKIN